MRGRGGIRSDGKRKLGFRSFVVFDLAFDTFFGILSRVAKLNYIVIVTANDRGKAPRSIGVAASVEGVLADSLLFPIPSVTSITAQHETRRLQDETIGRTSIDTEGALL